MSQAKLSTAGHPS